MNEKEKDVKNTLLKENFELNLPEFYKALNNAINNRNMQSIYGLSKIITRYWFKKLDN